MTIMNRIDKALDQCHDYYESGDISNSLICEVADTFSLDPDDLIAGCKMHGFI